MDESRIKGEAHKIKGSIKETIGKITGDRRIETEGKVEKTAGQAQSAAGKVADDVRDAVNTVADKMKGATEQVCSIADTKLR